jgi:hypothetical protein
MDASILAIHFDSFPVTAIGLDQVCILSPCFEEVLRELPYRAITPCPPGLPGGECPDLRDGVRDRDREPHLAERRQIREIIGQEGDVIPIQVVALEELSEGRELPPTGRLKALDTQLIGADPGGLRKTPTDQDDLDPGSPEEVDPEAVEDIEPLELDCLTGTGLTDIDPILGEYAIHIERDQAYAPRKLHR